MEDLFKKLSNYEGEESSFTEVEWKKLEKLMASKRRKKFLWLFLLIALFIPILLTAPYLLDLLTNSNNQSIVKTIDNKFSVKTESNAEKNIFETEKIGTKIKEVKYKKKRIKETTSLELVDEAEKINLFTNAEIEKKKPLTTKNRKLNDDEIQKSNSQATDKKMNSENNINQIKKQNNVLNKQVLDKRRKSFSVPQLHFDSSDQPFALKRKEKEVFKNLDRDNSVLDYAKEITDSLMDKKGLHELTKIELSNHKPLTVNAKLNEVKQSNQKFYYGVKGSLINSLTNQLGSNTSYGIAAFLRMEYEFSDKMGLSIQFGSQFESISSTTPYDYIKNKEVFLRESVRKSSIELKSIFLVNNQLSTFYKIDDKQSLELGLYYNWAFQSISSVSESGTGKYEEVDKAASDQWSYQGLLKPTELGFCLQYNLSLSPRWIISTQGLLGFTDRLDKIYFPNQAISKRSELSIGFLRKIK